jgi:tryptophan-rich sensory protein
MMICHWNNILQGEPLPDLTNYALIFGYIWPCVFLLLHLISFILAFKVPKHRLMNYTLAAYLLELILLSVTVLGYIMPMFKGIKTLT